MKNPFRRGSSGGAERSQGAHGVEAAKLDPIESTIQYLAGDVDRLPDKASILGELNVLGGTKDLTPDKKETLVDEILRERYSLEQRSARKD